jgi:formylglycine-generating enzyme required for sulfatase activity/serine/threonine protein kinase
MSEPFDGTRNQTPEDVRRLSSRPHPGFATGDTIPGLSSWRLERKLGGGGFGEVWLATHAWDREQKLRAVKFCTDPTARHRLVTHERNVVVRVMKHAGKHPNIVPLLDCNLDGDVPWLMYEFVEGGTLANLIGEWRELPLPKRFGRAVRTLRAIAGALATCHRLDPPLVHRDMKPQNVLMAGNTPRITDFGIGGVVVLSKGDGSTGAMTARDARLPSVLQSAGTRNYAPAEQLFGSPPNPRDDVYALGIIAYQMVMADLMTAPGADASAELRDLKVPGELKSLILRSVAMNPERRPKDATEWDLALAAIIQKAKKSSEVTGMSVVGSKPVLLDDIDWSQPIFETPLSVSGSTPVPFPEPTRNLPTRQVSPPIPLSLPTNLPPESKSAGKRESDKPARAKFTARPKFTMLLAGTVIFGLCLAAALMFLLPSGKWSESPHPTAGLGESKADGISAVWPEAEPKVQSGLKGGETQAVEIAAGVKTVFCYIPPGKWTLGSPTKKQQPSQPARWIDSRQLSSGAEVEHEFTSSGYWLGKYEVTQAQWLAVMGGMNPSSFDGKKDNKAKGMDTSRFPVENVSWDMICGKHGFLERANAHGGIRKAFGKLGQFRLPHEDEWEYAYRGGKGNGQVYYWGDKFTGSQANCNGGKGLFLERTCAVDNTNNGKYPSHPWGLMHMSGNVWEWCENSLNKDNNSRTLRGGGWSDYPNQCRGAYRYWHSPETERSDCGFRMCFSLE